MKTSNRLQRNLISREAFGLIKRFRALYLLLIPCVAFLLIFRYYPMMLQAVLAFKDYRLRDGVWGSAWIGFENFKYILSSPQMLRIIRNTVFISLLRLVVGFFPPIVLSIMLFDLTSRKLKRVCQTIVYIPHFFSWTIVYAIVFALFSNAGVVNGFLGQFGIEPQDFLMGRYYFLPLLLGSALWKELGWSTIIYLAALMSINTELFEVARIDGAGPLKRIWYVTLPSITFVIVFLLILSLGNILRGSGTEQILLFYSPPVFSIAAVMDTWVYRQGLSKIEYSLGSAVSFLQSVFGLILVLVANKLASKYAHVGLW